MLNIIKYFIAGALAKALASFDDTITRIPIIAQVTRARMGRIAFSIGNLSAVTAAIILAWTLSSILEEFPYTRIITSGLIFLLAILVYFDFLGKKEVKRIERTKKKVEIKISGMRFWRLVGIGFVVSFITLIDDFIVLTPLFFGSLVSQIATVIGIYMATIIQILLVIYMAEKIARWRYVKEITTIGLIILALVVYFQLL